MTPNRSYRPTTFRATRLDKVPLADIAFTEDGDPVDISTRTYAAQIRPSEGSAKVVDITIDDTDAATGVLHLSVDLTDADVSTGEWWWDLVQTNGTEVRTVHGGPFMIEPRITEVA